VRFYLDGALRVAMATEPGEHHIPAQGEFVRMQGVECRVSHRSWRYAWEADDSGGTTQVRTEVEIHLMRSLGKPGSFEVGRAAVNEEKRKALACVDELEREAVAHQGHRTGDHGDWVKHYRQRGKFVRRLVEALDGATVARIARDVGVEE
jgi:hypothetical protein